MKNTFLGVLEPEIADYWEISEHKNKPILVYDDRKQHVIDSHMEDFGNEDAINKSMESLGVIIKKPDYVFYNKETKGIEYYKNLNEQLCVAVRVNPGKVLKVRSWYPTNEGKIANRKKKELEIMSEKDK